MDRGTERGGIRREIRYAPLPSQKAFHRSKARYKGFSGPIGSGKSKALCYEALRLAYLNAGRMGLLAAPTYPMLKDSTLAAFTEVLQTNGIPYRHNKNENIIDLPDTGSRILLRSLEQYDRLRGTNLAWFGVDELTYARADAWARLEGRLRDPKAAVLCGFAVWTPRGFDWVYQRFVKAESGAYEVIFARASENKHLLTQVPDFYERLKGSYDEQFYRQEVLGEYLNVHQDRVYYCFDRGVHVGDQKPLPGRGLWWALDFNVDPMCSIVAQVRGGQVFVVDEIVLRRASTKGACEEFLARFGGAGGTLTVCGDASGARMQTAGLTDYQIIRKSLGDNWKGPVSYKVPPANPAVIERVNLVNGKLMPVSKQPNVFIDRKCQELIRDLEEVAYKPGTATIDKQNPLRTHLSDALGYLIWQEFAEHPTVGEQRGRLF